MVEEDAFVRIFGEFTKHVLGQARLFPKLSRHRIIEAHGAWQNDLRRVGGNEPNLDDGLDHFKQSGHLAFWIRRMSPVAGVIDLTHNFADAEGYPITGGEQAFRNLLFGYCNEYIAFDFGYQISRYYEIAKQGGSVRAAGMAPPEEYYLTMCHFLKYKTVSPHALFLVYKSLFLP